MMTRKLVTKRAVGSTDIENREAYNLYKYPGLKQAHTG